MGSGKSVNFGSLVAVLGLMAVGCSHSGSDTYVPPPPPAAPTGLTVTAISDTEVELSWIASAGASLYEVLRSTFSGGGYSQRGVPASTTFLDTGLANGETYFYVVRAIGTGVSGNSAEVSITTPPAVPTGLSATTVSETEIALSWSGSAGATGYEVLRGTTSGGPYAQVGTPTLTSFLDTGLSAATTYFYIVRATSPSGPSADSTEATATTSSPPPPPPPPSGLAATTISEAEINLSWSVATGATSYVVYGGTSSGGPYAQLGATTATSLEDTGLAPNTPYYYVVQATNAGGSSANSLEATSTTAPPPPAGFTATAVSDVQIDL